MNSLPKIKLADQNKKTKIQAKLIKHRFKSIGNIMVSRSSLNKYLKEPSVTKYAIDHIGGNGIDRKTKDLLIYGYENFLLIDGWAVDKKNSSTPKEIWVKINDSYYRTQSKIPRPDVATSLNNIDYLNAGFHLKIPRIFFDETKHHISLIIISKHGYYYSTKELTFSLHRYPAKLNGVHTISGKEQKPDEVIDHLYDQLNIKDQLISNFYNSYSWKITHPLRKIIDYWILITSIFRKANYQEFAKVYKEQGFLSLFNLVKNTTINKLFRKDITNYSLRDDNYKKFIELNKLNPQIVENMKSHNFGYQPLISIVTPVYNVKAKWLDACISSVLNQYYTNWELCLHDDASNNKSTVACLKKWEKKDPRIKISFGKKNVHISQASNEAIKLASGEFIGLLDNDDELTPDALFEVVKQLNNNPKIDFIYSDEDKLELNGERSQPYFKPDFSLDLFLSNNYLCHFSVVRKSLGDSVSWFRKGFEGSQDYDLFLRILEKTQQVYHIPKVLYHWRKIPGSTAVVYSVKSYANKASLNALSDYLKRNDIQGGVLNGLWQGSFRVKRVVNHSEMVSVIIPFKDQVSFLKECVESILNNTAYSNYEILLINNKSNQKETKKYLEKVSGIEKVTILEYPFAFNFSKINNWAADKANGSILLFLNNDTKVINNNWMGSMIEHIQRKDVGAVGAKLLFPNDQIQHAGVILGVGGIANHAFLNFHKDDNYYYGNSNVIRNYNACSAACLMVKKETYHEVGGMDEKLEIAYNDVDLCLKIRKLGLLITYTPYAQLYHFESKTRGYEIGQEKQKRLHNEGLHLQNTWGETLKKDPYYNPNFTTKQTNYQLNLKSAYE